MWILVAFVFSVEVEEASDVVLEVEEAVVVVHHYALPAAAAMLSCCGRRSNCSLMAVVSSQRASCVCESTMHPSQNRYL